MNQKNVDTDVNAIHEVPELSDRAQSLLKYLVEKYIDDGQPVGSRTLSTDSGLELSSASIRNVLADLEAKGLVQSPHTSSGRVPTDLGYRFFVDSLVTVKPVNNSQAKDIASQIRMEANANSIIASASDVLSEVTQLTSVVMLPRRKHTQLRKIEFLPLSQNRVLAIIVINECEVENRILNTSRNHTADELQKVSNYLNSMFSGTDLKTVRKQLMSELKLARKDVNDFMVTLVDMADQLFPDNHADELQQDELLVAGKTNLVFFQEMADTEKLKQLFEVFKQKQTILEVLDQCLLAHRMQIYIGGESGRQELDDCSMVTAPYEVDGELLGVLGVIGPMRMKYQKVIPVVGLTAKILGSALEFKK